MPAAPLKMTAVCALNFSKSAVGHALGLGRGLQTLHAFFAVLAGFGQILLRDSGPLPPCARLV